ncbi:MAG: hypothetical protein HYY14_03045 [Candidatus Omnitrophica bacterium]|nr:hypothetical protein [Candidatus Omnitrophota bacterium]
MTEKVFGIRAVCLLLCALAAVLCWPIGVVVKNANGSAQEAYSIDHTSERLFDLPDVQLTNKRLEFYRAQFASEGAYGKEPGESQLNPRVFEEGGRGNQEANNFWKYY